MKKLGEYTVDDFDKGDDVIYIPAHAHGDINHRDIERGMVSSINHKFVFVKYYAGLTKFGWHGVTSQATDPADLVKGE